MSRGETPERDDYNIGWTNIVDYLATVKIDSVPTYKWIFQMCLTIINILKMTILAIMWQAFN